MYIILYTYHKINNDQLRRDKGLVVLSFKINKSNTNTYYIITNKYSILNVHLYL